jgi:hypothetical protein
MPHLDLSDDEAAALIKEPHAIIENNRYPFSLRIRTLRVILAKLRPEPVRGPLRRCRRERRREPRLPKQAVDGQ